MNETKLEFALFCIDAVAEKLHISGRDAFGLLAEKSDVLDTYIIEHYEALHTQGDRYLANDIVNILKHDGVLV